MTGTVLDTHFRSAGVRCAAWHYRAADDSLAGAAGRPCVIMAHGFGATRDSGLAAFAEAFAAHGMDALVFDYRGFGASGGSPRQLVDLAGQLADYRAAVTAARGLDGVDPARIVLWGVSMSGGHVFRLAAEDPAVTAAVALTPAADGLAASIATLRAGGVAGAVRTVAVAGRDLVAAARGREPVLTPLAGRPGTPAALVAPGAYEAYTGMAGPSWRNEVAARVLPRIGSYRPGRAAGGVRCPILVQVGDLDRTAPPAAAVKAAARAPHAQVRHYPCDHFDVYPGRDWHSHVLAHQVGFLTRHLSR
jgi:uncharacterized protein